MIWFSSDWHLCHSNICRGSSRWPDTSECRDFDNAHFMNKTILENVNSLVAPNDILVVAGDFCFGGKRKIEEARSMINCRRVKLAFGNHDKFLKRKTELHRLFDEVGDILENCFGKTRVVTCHYQMANWPKKHYGAIHCWGHDHSNPRTICHGGMNVGVDGNRFFPYNLEEIISILEETDEDD